jgi:uncharacterized membrane protein (DUF373 family)
VNAPLQEAAVASQDRYLSAAFSLAERAVAIVVGVLLTLAVLLALSSAVSHAWDAVMQWPQLRGVVRIVDSLLFVLMLLEILQTVRSTLQSHELEATPFLIVGMIAVIRRILVVTLESLEGPADALGAAGPTLPFERAMIELGILAVLVLVLATAIYLLRQAKSRPQVDPAC